MATKQITTVLMAVAGVAALALAGVCFPPYACSWLPPYPSFADTVRFYWSPKAQFLRCNAILREIDAAKDEYALTEGVTNANDALTRAQIVRYVKDLGEPSGRCPSGGNFIIGPLVANPACTIHGDSLGWREGEEFPTRSNPAKPRSRPPAEPVTVISNLPESELQLEE